MASIDSRKKALKAKAVKYRAMKTPAAIERAGDIESWLLDITKMENELKLTIASAELEIESKLSEAEMKADEPLEEPTPDTDEPATSPPE